MLICNLYDESKVTVYQISLILIIGMTHIKRAKVAEEAKKEAENPMKGNFYYLYHIIYLKNFFDHILSVPFTYAIII